MADFQALYDMIVTGNADGAVEQTRLAIEDGAEAGTLLQETMIPAMDDVGRRFESNEFFIPQLMLASRAMQMALEVLGPHLAEAGIDKIGRVVIGTVQGDLHDIGKNLVASMLGGGGFEVVDLGVNVAPEKFVEAAREKPGSIVALSALLTTTMGVMRSVIEALEAAELRESTKVIIGGAPITQQFADSIGADGYSDNASGAVNLARTLFGV
jgi:methylmalonyl-CoA mutase cobalamin-binding domain/chain